MPAGGSGCKPLHSAIHGCTIDTATRHTSHSARAQCGRPGAPNPRYRHTEEDVMAQPRTARTHAGTWIVIAIVLAAALIGTLWVPFDHHLTPTLWGFPFLYWYQLMWVPIVAILSPIVFVFAPRLWSVSRVHSYITPADFIRGRYGSQGLALAVAVTGILATMPYIALQLVGIQAVLTVLGVGGDWPLIIAFVVLAGYTWLAGLRAPALIAFIKDTLIYVMIIVAIFYIPAKLGGWSHIFSTAGSHLATTNPKTGKPFGSLTVGPTAVWAYSSLALGSALALFMYPHAVTGVLASRRRSVIRRNMAILPAYSLMLGFVALLGYMALAAPGVPQAVKANGANAQLAVPFLFQKMFPPWF